MRPTIVTTIQAVTRCACLTLLASVALQAQSAPEELRITVGKSIVIDYPTDVGRISTSNPEIVDAVAVSTREILLHAKAHGISTVVVWAKAGQRTFYNISVEHNLEPIRTLLKDTFSDEHIMVQSARDSVSLIGNVSSQAVADRAGALVASLSKTVVNNLRVAEAAAEKQIMLRVRFAELNRSTSQEFGANLISTGALNTPGIITTGQFAPPIADTIRGSIPGGIPGTSTEFTLSDALNLFAFRPDLNLATTIRALQSRGLLQILAEPNLVTTNGKEASFLVGGEFPVPVLQGGSNAGAVTVQFREFGIRLTFTPALTPHKTMRLFVRPEVSTIDLANGVTFSGFRIPALATRRMETNIELSPGQSFVIGGLIDDRVQDSMTRIPGLSNIPILGALFKSRSESKSKSELIVMVTPEVVEPLNTIDPKPQPVWPLEFMGPYVKPTKSTKSRGKGGTMRAKTEPGDGQPAVANGAPQDAQHYVVKLQDLGPPAVGPPAVEPPAAEAPASADVDNGSVPGGALNGSTPAAPNAPTASKDEAATAPTEPVETARPTANDEPSLPEAVKPEPSSDTGASQPETPSQPAPRDDTTARERGDPKNDSTPEPANLPAKPAPAEPEPAAPAEARP